MTTTKITYYLYIFLMLGNTYAAKAQSLADSIVQPFKKYSSNTLQEKIFVHTDKEFYLAGEIMWFKLYSVDAHKNQPLLFSKISYVELLDKDRKPVLQAKIFINEEGNGSGSFQLPYSLHSGVYIFRAYTSWMKNGSPEYFFEKDIVIVNSLKKPEWKTVENKAYDIQFFPEGGNLVNRMQSKVAFKITDASGNGLACDGVLLNQRNDTVAVFSTQYFGMGNFDFIPDIGEKYHAVIRTGTGLVVSNSFPAVSPNGMVMRLVDSDKDKLLLRIQSKNAGSVVSLLVHTRNAVSYALSRELFNGKTEIEIDKKALEDGISHFTVFNKANQPVCERLFFKKPQSLFIAIQSDAKQYGERKKVTINIATSKASESPVAGNLSMSVYLLDSLQTTESSDIQSYLWLASELRGKIERPGFYFSANTQSAEAADNLMLTQGWRRFSWDTILKGITQEPEYLPEIEGHIITGKIIDKSSGQPAENITGYLWVPAEKSLFTSTTSSKNGTIRFNMMNFYGGNEIIVQTNSTSHTNYRIDINNPFSEKNTDRQLPLFTLDEGLSSVLLSHSIRSQAVNAYYADKQQRFLYPKNIDTTSFYGEPYKRYYLDEYTRFITMEEVMREYVAEVEVSKIRNHFILRAWNEPYKKYFSLDPLVLIDGVPIFDADKIIGFDPLKIKKIEVVANQFYQNGQLHEGIINFSTYQGDLAGYTLDINALIIEYEGLQLEREFYSQYGNSETVNLRIPDFRSLLYWSPQLQTGTDGKQNISFYTGDVSGKYAVVVQGITASGLAGSQTLVFDVKN